MDTDAHNLRKLAQASTLQELAVILGVHPTTARKVLRRLGIETARMRALRENAEAREAGSSIAHRTCATHGPQEFREFGGGFRCPRCNIERVMERRRTLKAILVQDAGSACRLCGYDRCLRALEFHHRDRDLKDFSIGRQGHTRSLARARAEVAKCVLLCSNCHMEVEAGIRSLD
jgi:transcription elongation factor Elf1